MNKKILNIILGVLIVIAFSFYIGAEETLNSSKEAQIVEGIVESPSAIYINLGEALSSDEIQNSLNELETIENTQNYFSENETNESIKKYSEETKNSEQDLKKENESGSVNTNLTSYEESSETSASKSHNLEKESNQKEVYYVDSEELGLNNCNEIEQEEIQDVGKGSEDKEITCFLYDSLGKKVIEIPNCESGRFETVREEIEIKELEKGDFQKEVTISSEQHFENPFVFYTSLATEVEKEKIEVYWKNEENLEITRLEEFSVKYYDDDENGLVDRISWIVPHLSEQIFNIIIKTNLSDNENVINLEVEGPPSLAINPIEFKVNLSYDFPEKVNCSLELEKDSATIFFEYFNITNETIGAPNLQNGNYNWEIICFDINNSNASAEIGNFVVSESFFSSLLEGKLYFLDLIENKIKNPETITINSSSSSNFSVDIIKNGGSIVFSKSYLNSASILINETILNTPGNYALRIYFNEPSPKYLIYTNFSVASANLLLNSTSIKKGESVKITINVNSPGKPLSTIILDYGDGTNDYVTPNSNTFSGEFTKKYLQKGTYSPKLLIAIPGENIFNSTKNGVTVIEVQNEGDTTSPSITLYEPAHKEILNDEIINFSYKASDNIKIQNCTFKLYNNCASLNSCSTGDSNLIFPLNSQQRAIATNSSVQNNKEMIIKLQDFEDGIYLWEVECYDNSSNSDFEWNIFQIANNTTVVSSSDYEQKEEIDALKEQADNFLNYGFNLEEKEVLDGLNLINDTKYYKKRLLDIQDFFEENYKYVSTEELREKKTEEYMQELEKIKNVIPLNVDVEENYEYIKNSVDKEFREIIEEYFSSTNTQFGKTSLKKLEEINKEIQNEISVSVNVKRVNIEYKNGTQEMVFVKKKVTINDDSYNKILEIIPEEIVENPQKIVFVTEKKTIDKNNIFEIESEKIKDNEIIYYITEPIKLKDIEKTETVLFEEDLSKFEKTSLTGFFVFNNFSGDLTIYVALAFILLIMLITLIPIVFKKFKMIGWKKEPNVVKMMDLIEEIGKLLKEKEIEKARESYYKVKSIYPVLPYKTKHYFYQKINELLVRIDKKDIMGLVKEYQEAKKRWDKENIMKLYEDIKKIYKRLPEKDRKKVYDIINGY